MKTINHIAAITLLFLFILSNISCKKFLDGNINASSYNDDSTLFSSVGGTYGALIGTYQNLTGDNAYGIRLSLYFSVDNDEMVGPTSTPYPDNDRRDLAHYGVNSNNAQLEQPFTNLYQGAEQANLCIYFIQRSKLYLSGNTQMRNMLAEAYTLRAQFYFDLVKIWGDVPFFTLPHIPSTHLPVYPAKTDRDSIYDHLLADLKFVEDSSLIGWRSQSSTERVSLEVVKGLRARIALHRAGYSLRANGQMVQGSNANTYYQIVTQECGDIINHYGQALNPSFKSVFTNNANHIFDKEILWAVGAAESGSNNGNTNTKLGYYDGPKLNDVPVYDSSATLTSMTVAQYGNGSLVVLPSYFYKFDSSDSRRDVTICIYNPTTYSGDTVVGTPTTKLTDGKFRRDWVSPAPFNNAEYMGIDWPLLRYSDILLMYAEADNELNSGPSPNALNYINWVRIRANVIPISSVGMTHDIFFNVLEKERSLEFGGEGLRKYDLIRWNLLNKKFSMLRGMPASSSPGPNQIDSFATVNRLWSNGAITTIPTSMYWSRNVDGSINWVSGTASWFKGYSSFYAKQISPNATATVVKEYGQTYVITPVGIFYKANWGSGSAGILPYASNGVTTNPVVFPYTGVNFVTGKSELYPFPIQEVQMNPNLQQNPGY